MRTVITRLKNNFSELDNTSAKIFMLGLVMFEICIAVSIILMAISLGANDIQYYDLTALAYIISGTGFRVFTLGVIMCFVSDIVFHLNT